MTTQEQRNIIASEAGYADAMAACLLQDKLHKISDGLSVDDSGTITLYDTGAKNPRLIVELEDDEMQALIEWYTDGICPVCFVGIPEGSVICDSCFDRAQTRHAYGPPLFPDDTLIGPEPKVPYRPKAGKPAQ